MFFARQRRYDPPCMNGRCTRPPNPLGMMATTEREPMLMRFALPKACAANARKMGYQTCRARPFIFQDLVFCMGLGDMHTYSHAENQGGLW